MSQRRVRACTHADERLNLVAFQPSEGHSIGVTSYIKRGLQVTTEERLENLERELACAKRHNRCLPICAGVCLGLIFGWALLAQPGLLGTAQASDPANPYEAEITKLQAEANLLKRENERLRKELAEAKKEKSAATPIDAQGPAAPQPSATKTPGADKPRTAVSMPGLPESDSSWWRDPEALTKHMELRFSMSATKSQASLGMWLQRHNYFAEQPVQWQVVIRNSLYVDKDTASIEYYKCLGSAKISSTNKMLPTVGKNDAEKYGIEEAWNEGEARAWKILMDAGGGVSLSGATPSERNKDFVSSNAVRVHIVLPGERSTAASVGVGMVLFQGKIVVLGAQGADPLAALTGRVSRLSVN